MNIESVSFTMPKPPTSSWTDVLTAAAKAIGCHPVRFAVVDSRCIGGEEWVCEAAVSEGMDSQTSFRPRSKTSSHPFTVAFVVPTGIGAKIGGHAGDATPALRLIAQVADRVIAHPNVVNASDINEMPVNGLYVEGSTLDRLLCGDIGLAQVRSNQILMAIDKSAPQRYRNRAANALGAAASTLGLNLCSVYFDGLRAKAEYSQQGTAGGTIVGLDSLVNKFQSFHVDALAVASVIEVPQGVQQQYFQSPDMVNPWGGVEAMLTHALSIKLNVPVAHAPIEANDEVAEWDLGVVDRRQAAEANSIAYLHCILKGLHRSPRIVKLDDAAVREPFLMGGLITAENIDAVVVPDRCLGQSVLAAFEQNIPVIAVRENTNLMQNDLEDTPCFLVDNYWEAAGVLAAMKDGMDPWMSRAEK